MVQLVDNHCSLNTRTPMSIFVLDLPLLPVNVAQYRHVCVNTVKPQPTNPLCGCLMDDP